MLSLMLLLQVTLVAVTLAAPAPFNGSVERPVEEHPVLLPVDHLEMFVADGTAESDAGLQQKHTEIMDGFVDIGEDSRDGHLDNGAMTFTFDGVLDVGQPLHDDDIELHSDADATATENDDVPRHYWRHDGLAPDTADGILENGGLNEYIDRIEDIGVDGIRENK